MSLALQPLLRFRVYPEGRSLYYVVYVWRTLKELRYMAQFRRVAGWRQTDAFVANRPVYGRRGDTYRMRPVCGEIHLSAPKLAVGIVSHECNHAAIAWALRLGFLSEVTRQTQPDRPAALCCQAEERLCYAQEKMLQQVVDRLWSAQLIQFR